MDDHEKIRKEAERDRYWAAMRENKNILQEVIQENEVEIEIDKQELACFCLKLILIDLDLYEDKFLEKDEEIEEIQKETDSNTKILFKLNFLSKILSIVYSYECNIDIKEKAINKIRKLESITSPLKKGGLVTT